MKRFCEINITSEMNIHSKYFQHCLHYKFMLFAVREHHCSKGGDPVDLLCPQEGECRREIVGKEDSLEGCIRQCESRIVPKPCHHYVWYNKTGTDQDNDCVILDMGEGVLKQNCTNCASGNCMFSVGKNICYLRFGR